MSNIPTAPINVRLRRASGEIIPLEFVFEGYRDGFAVWMPTREIEIQPGDRILADMLPARSALAIGVAPYEG